ncbi:hypothetical protein ACVWXM_006978 [Bradyrhizobium sp. GM7.3]
MWNTTSGSVFADPIAQQFFVANIDEVGLDVEIQQAEMVGISLRRKRYSRHLRAQRLEP